jgi:hypothetical protein
MFGFFKPQINGEIGYYNLVDWWQNTFSEEERNLIENRFRSITQKRITGTGQSCADFLTDLSSWFNTSIHRDIGKKIIEKACDEADKAQNTLDLHFALGMAISIFDDEENRIKFSEQQIGISPKAVQSFKRKGWFPVGHAGYGNLAIILERNKQFEKALIICKQAKQQKWDGDWDKRIERINKKIEKLIMSPD